MREGWREGGRKGGREGGRERKREREREADRQAQMKRDGDRYSRQMGGLGDYWDTPKSVCGMT